MRIRTFCNLALLSSLVLSGVAASATTSRELTLLYDGRSGLSIRGSWSLPAKDTATSEWSFYLSPKMGDFKVDRATCGGAPLAIQLLTFSEEGGDRLWKLVSKSPCSAGKPLLIRFHYRVKSVAPQLQVGMDGAFAGGSGELWYPQESFRALDTGLTKIVTPVGFTSIATGVLVRSIRRRNRIETRFRADKPSKLAFAIGRYSNASSLKPFPIRLLAVPPIPDGNKKAETLSRLLAPLQEAFGPAPERSLALVEVKFGGRVAGTSEYGMIFAERSKVVGPFDPPYWAHEFTHQWWGVSIHPKSGSPGAELLTEGMAQYGASLALENVEGKAAAAEYRRIDPKDSLAAYQKLVVAGQDRPLVGPIPRNDDEVIIMHHLATSKGSILLSQLEWLVGRESFHAVLRSFLNVHRGTSVSWDDLESAISTATKGQYRWWFDQWLHGAGAPSFSVRYSISGFEAEVTLHQEPPQPYHLLIPIRLCTAAGEQASLLESTSADARLTFHADAAITKLLVDPDMLVPNLNPRGVSAVAQHTCR
jgi:hypothetical protein